MRTTRMTMPALAVLVGLATIPAAFAQGGPPPPDGPNGFMGAPPNGPRGMNGPGQGQAPFAIGKVTAVDPTAGTVTLTSLFDGQTQVLHVASTVAITTQTAGTTADLKAGASVQVRRTGSALALTLGAAGTAGAGPGFSPDRRDRGPAVALIASGTIRTTNPLVIDIGTDAALTLRLTSATTITNNVTLPLSSVKVGDSVAARGQMGSDGSFSAASVVVNPNLGGFSGRMAGGPQAAFAGPGFGPGPGGPPPGDGAE